MVKGVRGDGSESTLERPRGKVTEHLETREPRKGRGQRALRQSTKKEYPEKLVRGRVLGARMPREKAPI